MELARIKYTKDGSGHNRYVQMYRVIIKKKVLNIRAAAKNS